MSKIMEEIRMEGHKEGRKETVIGLLALGKLSHEEIAKCAKVSIEEVDELAKEMSKDLSKVG